MRAFEEMVIFVWRCESCSRVYDIESLAFLYSDERRYCWCGGELVEGVEPESAHRRRMVVPERFAGGRLYRELARREKGVETTVGWRGGVRLFCEV